MHVLVGHAEGNAAEAAATNAVALFQASDELALRGDALVDLAFVHERAGRADKATHALSDAIALHERKGNIVSSARARARLERLARGAGVTDV